MICHQSSVGGEGGIDGFDLSLSENHAHRHSTLPQAMSARTAGASAGWRTSAAAAKDDEAFIRK